MKFVTAALIGVVTLIAIGAGVARATTGGGGTIATAPVVISGVPGNGSTSTYTDSCGNGFEFWRLQLEKGDLVQISWGDTQAVDKLALWPAGTGDSAYGSACVYEPGLSEWNVSPVLSDSNSTPGTPLVSHTFVSQDGTYPLLFVDTTGANAGPYSFTATVLHAASVSLPHVSTIPGAGWVKASAVAPDGSLISDSTLKLTLSGYWSDSAGARPRGHRLATATPTSGSATFNYSLPARVWGKKIRLQITGGGHGSDYQALASQSRSVSVLVPDGPVLASPTQLKLESKLLRQPIYWAGPRKGYHYEFTRLQNDNIYVRYLPKRVKVNGKPGRLLIVATYPYPGAYAALKKAANGKAVAGPHGSIYFVRPGYPKSVYVAFPKVNFEIEVYDPSPAVAKAIAATGRVAPVR
jgi:hypothetical protein